MISKKLLINAFCEFGPILAFLVLFEIKDFMAGIVAMMIATIMSLFVLYHFEKHVPIFALISSGSVLLFGGISLFIEIPDVFILRDTIFDAVFGSVLVASVLYGKPLFKYIFRGVFAITDIGWSKLSLRWGIFFLTLALINEWVRQTLSPEDWVVAKIYIIIASVIFGVYQLRLTRRERLPESTAWGVKI
jgi:intracellular septation protein